ncbi:histone deacetylase [Kitasatospora sp. NPDC089913]|uniref:histone deacetylase n=1 Tax=Kitasatospora sp. NPDC089913 TaxID=3364080 RepID=UPI0038269F11
MHLDRLMNYIAGGRPPGGTRVYPGCRDRTPPRAALPVLLPGQLYFSLESKVWSGGMGFYDQTDAGEMPARAYLITPEQFSDIAAQEMHDEPGRNLDLAPVLASGEVRLGPGRYETLVCPGQIDGYPVLTFTAPWRRADAAVTRPSAAYLRNFASGLSEAHGWSVEDSAKYLSARPGASGTWTAEAIVAALSADPVSIGSPDS